MAEHGTTDYATAEGNDLPMHETTYARFVHFVFVGTVHVVNILIGLAVGGVGGSWLLAFLIFIIATFAAALNLFTGNRGASIAALIFALLVLLSRAA